MEELPGDQSDPTQAAAFSAIRCGAPSPSLEDCRRTEAGRSLAAARHEGDGDAKASAPETGRRARSGVRGRRDRRAHRRRQAGGESSGPGEGVGPSRPRIPCVGGFPPAQAFCDTADEEERVAEAIKRSRLLPAPGRPPPAVGSRDSEGARLFHGGGNPGEASLGTGEIPPAAPVDAVVAGTAKEKGVVTGRGAWAGESRETQRVRSRGDGLLLQVGASCSRTPTVPRGPVARSLHERETLPALLSWAAPPGMMHVITVAATAPFRGRFACEAPGTGPRPYDGPEIKKALQDGAWVAYELGTGRPLVSPFALGIPASRYGG